jgi:hypothetical protein
LRGAWNELTSDVPKQTPQLKGCFMKNHIAIILCIYATMNSIALAANPAPLFLTETNGPVNYLAVVNANTKQTEYIPTGGTGGVGPGNIAGAVAVSGKLAAVVNYGSSNVTVFVRQGNTMQPTQVIKTASKPVSVAFGFDHLVVLELTSAESFPVFGTNVVPGADGNVSLQIGDGSSGQIVTFSGGVAYTEKSGSLVELSLSTNGSPGLSGPNVPVTLPPAPNNSVPLGLVGRGANIYATIAHSDLEALVVGGRIVSMASAQTPYANPAGGFFHAPCWNTLSGQFLFSADSPAKQIVRFLVSDAGVYFDKAGVAALLGPPTDLVAAGTLLGVIDGGDGTNSNVSLFNIDSEGELTLRFSQRISGPITGAAIIQ